jgi:ABC-2 type transport system permease protein
MTTTATPRVVGATTARVLTQLRHDPRTIGLLLGVPLVLIALLRAMFPRPQFDAVALLMIGIFPFVIMFLVTGIAMLRERSSGTLERLMTTPARPVQLLAGYGLAFGLAAAAQSLLVVAVLYWVFGSRPPGGPGAVIAVAVLTALLGVGLGLASSAFARTEFQAVQMLPVVVIPQILLCGLFVDRSAMAGWLRVLSDVLPLSYAVQALQRVAGSAAADAVYWRDIGILAGCVILAVVAAAATMRRRTR